MGDELLKIQLDYLKRRYDRLPEDMDQRLVAVREKEMFHLLLLFTELRSHQIKILLLFLFEFLILLQSQNFSIHEQSI